MRGFSSRVATLTSVAVLILLALIFPGCRPYSAPAAFSFQSVPTSGWNPEEVVEFSPDCIPQGDSIPFAAKELTPPRLWIRYNLTAPERLPLVLFCEQLEEGAPLTDTLRITLFRENQPTGKGQRGLFEISIPLPSRMVPMVNYRFNTLPEPTLSVSSDSLQSVEVADSLNNRKYYYPDSLRLADGWRLTIYPLARTGGISEIGISF